LNYKKIIKNQHIRLKVLSLFDFIPDKQMIYLQYFIKTGRKLKLKNPKRYTEKLQWYKLYYRDPLMIQCADKYSVREYVERKGLARILNPLYGVYDQVDQIDFDALPNSFAIKYNNGSGANIFIKDKKKMDKKNTKEIISKWMGKSKITYGREWCYSNIPSKITVEKLIKRNSENDLPDYKFFCFNGRVEYLYTMIDYVDDHENGKCSFFTPEFQKLPYRRSEYKAIDRDIVKPENFEEMIKIAECLSEDFPHARVDLYNVEGQITFGEITFYNASGYTVFSPDEFDFILGNKFILPEKKI
jgi:hypothetical protein